MLHVVYSISLVNNIGIHVYLRGDFLHKVIICESYCKYVIRNKPMLLKVLLFRKRVII